MSAFPLTLYKKMLLELNGNRFMVKEFHISTYLDLHIYFSSVYICAIRQFASSFSQMVMTCNFTSCTRKDCNICSKLCNTRTRIKL